MSKSIIVLSVSFMFFGAFAAAAAQKDNLPILDVQKLCRDRSKTMGDLAVGLDAAPETLVKSCVTNEQKARDALAAAWKQIPSRLKESCVRPNAYSPSYLEWISCLEMHIELKTLRLRQ